MTAFLTSVAVMMISFVPESGITVRAAESEGTSDKEIYKVAKITDEKNADGKYT